MYDNDQALRDKTFLKKLNDFPTHETQAKVIVLNYDEAAMGDITGAIESGSVSVDGSAACRRTCQLSLFTTDNNVNNLDWQLHSKYRVSIGQRNFVDDRYPDWIWFPMGTYILTDMSLSNKLNGFSISLTGKDKICLIDGTVGGALFADHDFAYQDVVNSDEGTTYKEAIPIYEMIREAVHVYAREPYWNIIINDLDDVSVELLDYKLDNLDAYLYDYSKDINFSKYMTTISFDDSSNPNGLWVNVFNKHQEEWWSTPGNFVRYPDSSDGYYYRVIKKLTYGATAGYRETDLTYPTELVISAGGTIVEMLNKVCEMLGEFEYFYDVYGHFVFRRKQIYHNVTWSGTAVKDDEELTGYYTSAEATSTIYDFTNSNIIESFSNKPKLSNIKNDFSIWGKIGTANKSSNSKWPFHLRYAIDDKPKVYHCLSDGYWYVVEGYDFDTDENQDDQAHIEFNLLLSQYKAYLQSFNNSGQGTVISDQELNSKLTSMRNNLKSRFKVVDWRELIYRMAIDYSRASSYIKELSRIENRDARGLYNIHLLKQEKMIDQNTRISYINDIFGLNHSTYRTLILAYQDELETKQVQYASDPSQADLLERINELQDAIDRLYQSSVNCTWYYDLQSDTFKQYLLKDLEKINYGDEDDPDDTGRFGNGQSLLTYTQWIKSKKALLWYGKNTEIEDPDYETATYVNLYDADARYTREKNQEGENTGNWLPKDNWVPTGRPYAIQGLDINWYIYGMKVVGWYNIKYNNSIYYSPRIRINKADTVEVIKQQTAQWEQRLNSNYAIYFTDMLSFWTLYYKVDNDLTKTDGSKLLTEGLQYTSSMLDLVKSNQFASYQNSFYTKMKQIYKNTTMTDEEKAGWRSTYQSAYLTNLEKIQSNLEEYESNIEKKQSELSDTNYLKYYQSGAVDKLIELCLEYIENQTNLITPTYTDETMVENTKITYEAFKKAQDNIISTFSTEQSKLQTSIVDAAFQIWTENGHWNPDVIYRDPDTKLITFIAPEDMLFWFDFMDFSNLTSDIAEVKTKEHLEDFSKYKISVIGHRAKTINDDQIKAIFYRDVPPILWVGEQSKDGDTLGGNGSISYARLSLTQGLSNYFKISTQGKSAKEELDTLIEECTNYQETITISCIPIYWFEPNQRIRVVDIKSGISGEYIVKSFSFQLKYDGMMSIQAYRAASRIL